MPTVWLGELQTVDSSSLSCSHSKYDNTSACAVKPAQDSRLSASHLSAPTLALGSLRGTLIAQIIGSDSCSLGDYYREDSIHAQFMFLENLVYH